jgi:hypothetical protein
VEGSGGHRGGVVAHGSILPNAEERERERGADDRDADERVAANDGRDSTYATGK